MPRTIKKYSLNFLQILYLYIFNQKPEQPENKDNIGEVKEEQADHQSEELSVSNVSTNYITPEGHVTSECSTKLTGDVDVDGRTIAPLQENISYIPTIRSSVFIFYFFYA